ncbi:MAG: glycine--tRNA ligase subunit beta [Chloroflexota bacterium]
MREDLKKPLAEYLPRLDTLTFQFKLGSMLDKTRRITQLAQELGRALGLDQAELAVTQRAAELAKADLATHMVVEMTSLQGQMGRFYALKSGESQVVAEAIFEHYLPRYAGDAGPQGKPGLVIGLADRLDTLAGLFAADLAPSGNKDPFAQRRAALGLVQNLLGWDLDLELRPALQAAANYLPLQAGEKSLQAVYDFIVERLRNVLLDQGHRYDVVDAVLLAQGGSPARAARAIRALEAWTGRPDWPVVLATYARCVRITRDLKESFSVDPGVLAEPAEQQLYAALQQAEAVQRAPGAVDDFFTAFLPLMPAIQHFFDKVLVMAEDPALRRSRLGMLQRIARLAGGVADFSKLEGF